MILFKEFNLAAFYWDFKGFFTCFVGHPVPLNNLWPDQISHTGCPTKHNSWWIVLNVVFHTLYKALKTFCSLFLQKKSYSKLFHFEINFDCHVRYFIILFKELNKLWKMTFKTVYHCHVSSDTLYFWLLNFLFVFLTGHKPPLGSFWSW